MTTKIVTITKVKTPWYLPLFMLRKAFINSIPEYASKEGLLFKYYHITEKGKTFGGIYLWKNEASANALFNEDWFEQVRKKLKTEGVVQYYDVIESKTSDAVIQYSELKKTKATLVNIALNFKIDDQKVLNSGLLQMYKLKNNERCYAILLFENDEKLKNYLKLNPLDLIQTFDTPVLLNNS